MIAKVKCFWSFIYLLTQLSKEMYGNHCWELGVCEYRGFKWKVNVTNFLMEQKSDILLRTKFWLNSCFLKQIKTNLVLLR